MIWQHQPYVTLMASLPPIRLLSDKVPPINRSRLVDRLKTLAPEDAALLGQLTSVVAWSSIDVTQDDETYLASVEVLLAKIKSPTIVAALQGRLELRTVLAALRRRHSGEDAPIKGARWGYGPHVDRIRQNWTQPDFGVSIFYPWIDAAREAIEAGDSVALERLVLEVSWAQQERLNLGHEFDLEAVALYLVRWSLADRWARYDADVAARRFEDLLDAAIAEAPEIMEAA